MTGFKQGDRVRVEAPGKRYDGVTGVVACVYSTGLVDVDMADGPDQGWIGRFDPRTLRGVG